LFLLQARVRNQIIKLDPEQDLAVGLKLRRQLLRHGGQILLLIKRLTKELAQLRVDRFRIIVTKKSQARVDFLLEQNAIRFRKTGQNLNEKRQKIRSLRNTARFAKSTTHPASASPLDSIGKRRDTLHRAINFVCHQVECRHFQELAGQNYRRAAPTQNAINRGKKSDLFPHVSASRILPARL